MKKYFLCFLLTLTACVSNVYATNPIILNMIRPHHHSAPRQIEAMVRGFAACDPDAALPRTAFEVRGVRFIDHHPLPMFLNADLLDDRSVVVLLGNDPATMEFAGSGLYVGYGSAYHLQSPLHVVDGVEITSVKASTSVKKPRAVLGITYGFDKPVPAVIEKLNKAYHLHIVPASRAPDIGLASSRKVWFSIDKTAKTVSCWRYPESYRG